MNLQYLIKYKTFSSVKEMDEMVKEHINYHRDVLTPSNIEVLYCLASHSLTAYGASHLLTSTIAKEIGVSERTIQRSTKVLTDLGIISKHKTVKRTGQGASIYVIAPKIKMSDVGHQMSPACQSLETHVSLTAPTDSHAETQTVTKNLITSSFNPFVVNNLENNVHAQGESDDLKILLRQAYKPETQEQEKDFEELCKIGFGRLKQFMKFYNLPYLQIKEIVLRCMHQLVNKSNVKNIFAMYSKMIERQVKQLFEKPVTPQLKAEPYAKTYKKEVVPEWFATRNDKPVASEDTFDFEAARLAVLAKLS